MMNDDSSPASPEMVPLLSEDIDDITPALTSVRVDGDNEIDKGEYGAVEKPKKKGKSAHKIVADALKTDMAAERTFFKWLWTGLHTGAIGSFIFVTFDVDKSDPMRVVIVGFSWFVALLLVFYGVFAYYRRRYALRTGNLDHVPSFTREHSPLVVVFALLLVVGVTMSYALMSGGDAKQSSASNSGTQPVIGGQR